MIRVLVALLAVVPGACAPAATGGARATVVRVVDGDTLRVALDGEEARVRLIGVDTPETVHPRVPDQCFGAEASARMRELLDGEEVRLVYDVEQQDRYGRTLAYVYRARDDLFVNLHLIEEGLATLLTVPPNVAHAAAFARAQRAARETGAGLWSACAPFG